MPALEALGSKLNGANVQPIGISIDSVHSHANWAFSRGGVSFPLLSDFHPKGAMADSYGLYLGDKGFTDRATVIVDADGVVQHSSSVGPGGERNIDELVDLCVKISNDHQGDLPASATPPGLAEGSTLFVKSNCAASRSTLLARDNLHLVDSLPVRNVSEDEQAMTDLKEISGKQQAPCLVTGGEAMLESADIVLKMANETAGL